MEAQEHNEPWLITVEQAAQHLNISRTKTYELISSDGLPVVRLGRLVRIDPKDLQRWLEQRKQTPLEKRFHHE